MKLNYSFPLIFFYLIVLSNCTSNKSQLSNNQFVKDVERKYNIAFQNRADLSKSLRPLDSAISIAKKIGNDTLLLKCHSLKSVLYGKNRDFDQALYYSKELLLLADSLDNLNYKAKAYFKIGNYQYSMHDFHGAFSNFINSKTIYEELKDSVSVAVRSLDLTYVQLKLGSYLQAEESAIEGLKFLSNIDHKTKYKLYNVLATINLKQRDLSRAMKYRNKAIEGYINKPKRNRRDSLSLLRYFNNKALIYLESESYGEALNLLEEIKTWGVIRDSSFLNEKARVLGNIGKVKIRQGEEDAISYLKRSYNIRVSINDKLGLNASLNNFSEYYLSKQQFDSANYWGKKAYENAKDLKSPVAEKKALIDLLTIGENQDKLSNREVENHYFSKYLVITDSLERMSSEIDNIYAEQKYRAEQHKIRALKNKSDADRHKFLAILVSILGIALVSLLIVYYYYANKAKKERFKKQTAREVYNTEIRLSKKVHDELANDMYAVMTQLQHQTNEVELEALLDKLEVIYERSRDISRATGDIDTENFNAVLRQMLDGYTNDHVNVIMNGLVQGFWKEIAPYKKVEIFRVLRELMTNMKKHSKATLVVVRFKKEGKTLVVSYVDNGKGVDFNQIKYSNGLQNVENRIAGINGGIIFDSKPGKGFKAKITLT